MADQPEILQSLQKYTDSFVEASVDTHKESLRVLLSTLSPVFGRSTASLKNALHEIFRLESKYHALQFSSRKTIFTSEENLEKLYSDLCDSFCLLKSENSNCDSQSFDEVLSAFCGFLANFCHVRIDLIKFYKNLIEHETALSFPTENFQTELADLCLFVQRGLSDFLEPVLAPMTNLIKQEIELLLCLLKGQDFISNLHFLSSLLCLKSFAKYCENVDNNVHLLPWRISGANSSALFNWLLKFHGTLLAKFSLYWFSVLYEVGKPDFFLRCLSKEKPDLVLRIHSFCCRTEVAYVSLFFDTRLQDVAYLGHSYVSPGSMGALLKGVDSLPSIFTMPLEAEKDLKDDLPAIMMKLNALTVVDVSKQPRKIISFFNPDLNKTFLLAKVELRVYIALISKGDQLSNSQLFDFVKKISDSLQLIDLSQSLRST